MCGLVGVAGLINIAEERAFKDLLILDVIRGKHSTGVASMYGTEALPSFRVFKDKLNAVDYSDLAGFTEIMRPKSRILMGHNRAATRGTIIAENAHPFEFEHIIGAHNGTLNSYWKMHNHDKFQVDSQALYSELNENGVSEMWSKTNGAAALTWINKDENSLNMMRNKERPLHYVYSNAGKTLWWASEFWMLVVALSRNGIEADGKIFELPINEHFKFDIPFNDKDSVVLHRTKVNPYVAPVYTYPTYKAADGGHYDAGKKHLERENAKVGDRIAFEVEQIRDVFRAGTTNVFATSIKGTPVRVWNLSIDRYPDLVDALWQIEGGIFTGTVAYAQEAGLILNHTSLEYSGVTLDDVLDADKATITQSFEAAVAKKEGNVVNIDRTKERVAAYNAEKSVYTPITLTYSTVCDSCDQFVKTYYMVGHRRMCKTCLDVHTAHGSDKVH